MHRTPLSVAAQLLWISLALSWTPLAYASLGGDIGSIAADQSVLQGTLAVTARPRYELREINTLSGMSVREFVNPSGTVFAISWSGPAVPNLTALLGTHYADAARALSQLQQPGTHRALRIETPELVIEISGHLRSYSGLALLRPLLPAGLTVSELR